MGKLIYGPDTLEVDFDDRVLAHLQVVFSAKLRRGESFFFNWFDTPAVGDGRSGLWISPSIPLYFSYDDAKAPALNRAWLEQMSIAASGNQGLLLTTEPGTDETVLSEDNDVKRKK